MTKNFCQLEEVSLINILTLQENKLQKNFQVIVKCLESNTNKLTELQIRLAQHQKSNYERFNKVSSGSQESHKGMEELKIRTQKLSALLEQYNSCTHKELQETQHLIQSNHKELKGSITTMGEEQKKIKNQMELMQDEDRKIIDIINIKSDKAQNESDRVKKELNQLIIKSENLSKKFKKIEDSVQNMEVQNDNNPLNFSNKPEKYTEFLYKLVNQVKRLDDGGSKPRRLDQCSSPKRSSLIYSPLFNEQQEIKDLKTIVNDMKSRMEIYELRGNEGSNKVMDKIMQDLNQLKTMRNQMKRQAIKQRSEMPNNTLLEKIQELRPEINKICSRIDTMEDKLMFSEKRIEDSKKNIGELITYVKENNLSKYEEKLKSIQSEFFAQIKDINTKLELKTNQSDFLKVCHAYEQRFKDINQILITKCEKVEVKKALLFIESKIKEIILVISEDEQNQKDALLTKKNVKCISCDKELDKYAGLVSQDARNWNMLPNKELQSQNLGKFGITKFGSLAKKLKKLQGGELPLLRSKKENE